MADESLTLLKNDGVLAVPQARLAKIVNISVQKLEADAAPLREADIAFINKVVAAKPKAVVAMSYGNPQLIRRIESVPAFLVGYGEKGWFGNQAVYFDSFIKLLKGELKPRGKLPVKVNDRFPLGTGLTY